MNQENNIKLVIDKIDNLNLEAWKLRVSDSGRALVLSEEATRLAISIDYPKGKAEALRTLGFSHIRLSKHKEALRFLEESLNLFVSLNDLSGQSDVIEYLGIIQRSLGNYEASLDYLFKSLEIRKQLDYSEGESLSLYHLGVTFKYLGNYEQALDHFLKSLSIARANNYWIPYSYSLNNIGLIYFENDDFENALEYFHQSLAIRGDSGDKWGEAGCLDNIGFGYFKMKQYEKAIDYCSRSFQISQSVNDQKGQGNALFHLGNIYGKSGLYEKALESYNSSLQIRRKISDKKGEAEILLHLAGLYANDDFDQQNMSKALELMNEALKLGNEVRANDLLAKIHHGYYEVSKKNNRYEDALLHLETYLKIEKEVHTAAINQKILNLEISHRVENSRREAEIYKLRNIELVNLNEEIKKQKEEIEVRKTNAEDALSKLKATQAQLIQSEKMASLGELTAGIAHEIQNPLNFVNNFSEVSVELADELKNELNKFDLPSDKKTALTLLVDDLVQNQDKINHHGRRADAIVKGMLQHSRSSTGEKEPTDINALVDEYLRLSYHGLRAKEKSFNATMKTDYDESIGNIYIIPQDIGRVILNLITNAFYAVTEKKQQQNVDFEPTVAVSTKKFNARPGDPRLNDLVGQVAGRDKPDSYWIEINVKDNGNGIPQKVLDKIFQPFFTTKPTGQGTGLGLSLSYDIIKAHGGELKVETEEGSGAEFIIQLPA